MSFWGTTGYNRCDARWVLRQQGRQVQLDLTRVVEGDASRRRPRTKPRIYDTRVAQVRRAVGYQRFDTVKEGLLLNQLYDTLRLFTNFFQPTMKLKSKERLGSRVKKSYESPQTPYRRGLDSAGHGHRQANSGEAIRTT